MKADNLQTLKSFVTSNSYKDLENKRILNLEKNKVLYAHFTCFKESEIELFYDYSKQPYNFRLYGGESPTSDEVEWIYSSYFVIPDNLLLAKNQKSGEFELFPPEYIKKVYGEIKESEYQFFANKLANINN